MPRRRGEQRRAGRASVGLLAVGLATAGCMPPPVADTGPQVTVFGTWRGEAADLFRASMEPFEERTGIDIVYTGTGDFASELVDRIQGGDPPDIAMFPQPGLLDRLADEGYVLPVPRTIAEEAADSYRASLRDIVGEPSEVNGVLYQVNVKSLVWFLPGVFEAQGYRVPKNWDELQELTAAMIDDGFTPWCLGAEAFSASGWPATDWIEDIILRTAGPEVYDAWVAGEVPFSDPAIDAAYAQFGRLLLQPGDTFGGRRGILNTAVDRAQAPMFADEPGCLLYRQASFQVENLPEGTRIGPNGDVDFFVLPDQGGGSAPLLVGGNVAGAMTDRGETWQVLEYLASEESGAAWRQAGGFISPHASAGAADYPQPFDGTISVLLDRAAVARFDGSDLMDPRVGTGTFLESVLYYIGTLRRAEALAIAESGYRAQSGPLP